MTGRLPVAILAGTVLAVSMLARPGEAQVGGVLSLIPEEAAIEHDLVLPYGTIPRLIFLWLSTEVTLTKQRELYLGKTKTDFMLRTGLQPRTGKRGNMKMFEQQLNSLLFTSFSAWRKDGDSKTGNLSIHHRKIASDYQLWWNQEGASRISGGVLNLDHDFFTEMLNSGIPVNLDTIAALKDSSMALDIYIWLTYRFHTLRKPQPFPWEWLYDQFGGNEYGENKEGRKSFKRNFVKALKKVLEHYTDANAFPKPAGLVLLPSPTHVKIIQQ